MPRQHLSFDAVNRRDRPGYDSGLQRHHLLPRQILGHPMFARMFASIGGQHYRFEDFRENGLLLPCSEVAAIRLGLPMHRGPHRRYSELAIERVGQIEAGWVALARRDPAAAAAKAQMRLGLLQRALRRYLLARRRSRPLLSRLDPLGAGPDFVELDAVADALWGATDGLLAMRRGAQSMPAREQSSSRAA